jgi:hypothetical protein
MAVWPKQREHLLLLLSLLSFNAATVPPELEDVAFLKETPKSIACPTRRGYDYILSVWKEYKSCRFLSEKWLLLIGNNSFLYHINSPTLASTAGVLKVFFKTMVLNHKGDTW